MNQVNLFQLMDDYDSEKECRDALADLRWPEGVACPRCQATKHAYDSERYVWDCYSCGYQFSVMSGTIFHDTKLPLRKWFMAVLLMAEARKGVSANQMKRTIGVSYKTAWYLCHRIRAAMKDANPTLLSGIVEVDETHVGGVKKGVGKGNYQSLTPLVVGAIQRGGNVRLKVEKRRDRKTLHAFIRATVADSAEAIHTDEWSPYRGIGDETTRHETVNHHQEEWVRGDVHTNTVEGVWSLFKRSLVGSYHQLSTKHLPAYLDEFSFRFNNRHNAYLFRDTLMRLVGAPTLEYKELISA